ncbi:MAG TPA: PH domain-containing protein [Candidatus Dormibacteraeota bacterium]|nr:PH domain-containing protein [Candidatus Dormibacteraeota bacterium]
MARYADRLLADGERVALRGRQHVLATIIEGRVAWSILIASLVIVILDAFFLSTNDIVRQAFGWIGLALLVISLLWLLKIYVEWYAEDYVITNRRVMKVEGVLKKRSADSSLEKINDAVLEQSVLGRMLGYGNLEILTAAEESVARYRMLAQVQLFKRTMLDEKHKLEQEAFQIPAPPLRASVPMPPPAPAAAPEPTRAPVAEPAPGAVADAGVAPDVASAPAAPAKTSMTSDEITKTLASMADLRDRGAISPEEYEAKKTELLGRL